MIFYLCFDKGLVYILPFFVFFVEDTLFVLVGGLLDLVFLFLLVVVQLEAFMVTKYMLIDVLRILLTVTVCFMNVMLKQRHKNNSHKIFKSCDFHAEKNSIKQLVQNILFGYP